MDKHTFTIAGQTIELDNDEAIDLLNQFRRVFGWEGTEFQRVDVEETLGRPLTEDEWNEVQGNYFWRKGITESACEGGWSAIDNLINDLNLEGE